MIYQPKVLLGINTAISCVLGIGIQVIKYPIEKHNTWTNIYIQFLFWELQVSIKRKSV